MTKRACFRSRVVGEDGGQKSGRLDAFHGFRASVAGGGSSRQSVSQLRDRRGARAREAGGESFLWWALASRREATVAAPANARERVVWVLSVLLRGRHGFLVDVDVTPLGVGVAFGVFATGLLAYGVGGSFSSSLKWPYKMSPLACAVFVACALSRAATCVISQFLS